MGRVCLPCQYFWQVFCCLVLITIPTQISAQACYDLNSDGKVDFADFIIFAQRYDGGPGKYGWHGFIDLTRQFGKPTECATKFDAYDKAYPSPKLSLEFVGPCSVRVSWESMKGRGIHPLVGHWAIRTPHIPGKFGTGLRAHSKDYQELGSDITSHTFYPILASTEYTFTIMALYSDRGLPNGSRHGKITVETPPFETIGSPVLILYGITSRRAFTVMWSPQPRSKGYDLLLRGPGQNYPEIWVGPSVTKISCEGLQPGGIYTAKVRTWGNVGPTKWSDPLVVELPSGMIQ